MAECKKCDWGYRTLIGFYCKKKEKGIFFPCIFRFCKFYIPRTPKERGVDNG